MVLKIIIVGCLLLGMVCAVSCDTETEPADADPEPIDLGIELVEEPRIDNSLLDRTTDVYFTLTNTSSANYDRVDVVITLYDSDGYTCDKFVGYVEFLSSGQTKNFRHQFDTYGTSCDLEITGAS